MASVLLADFVTNLWFSLALAKTVFKGCIGA